MKRARGLAGSRCGSGGGNYLLQTATAAIKAAEQVIDVESTTESTTTTPGRYSGAGIVPRPLKA